MNPDFKLLHEHAGPRRPFEVLHRGRAPDGTRWVRYAVDLWEGGSTAEDVGHWQRWAGTVTAGTVRQHVSPGVSYWDALQKALAA